MDWSLGVGSLGDSAHGIRTCTMMSYLLEYADKKHVGQNTNRKDVQGPGAWNPKFENWFSKRAATSTVSVPVKGGGTIAILQELNSKACTPLYYLTQNARCSINVSP